jgi:hypothetical protein
MTIMISLPVFPVLPVVDSCVPISPDSIPLK